MLPRTGCFRLGSNCSSSILSVTLKASVIDSKRHIQMGILRLLSGKLEATAILNVFARNEREAAKQANGKWSVGIRVTLV